MKKIFKKPLALFVSSALCITAFMGCLTASAEGDQTAKTGSVTIGNTSVEPGATTATVPITITTDDENGIAAALLKVKYNNKALTSATLNNPQDVYCDIAVDPDTDENLVVADPDNADLETITMIIEAGTETEIAHATTLEVELTFNVVDGATPDSYNVEVDYSEACNAGRYEAQGDGSYTLVDGSVEDMVTLTAQNGVVTIKGAAPVEDTLTTSVNTISGNTKYTLAVKFDYTFTGTVKTYGVIMYRAASYTDGMDVSVDSADLSSTLSDPSKFISLAGFAPSNITEKFVLVPYVIGSDDAYYYGGVEKISYVDYLLDKLANGADDLKAKAKSILDMYYLAYGTPAYEDQAQPVYPEFTKEGTYTAATEITTEDCGDFNSTTTLLGSTKGEIGVKFDFSNYTGEVAEYGILFYRKASYKDGMNVSLENSNLNIVLTSSTASTKLSGFSFESFNESFVFVPYVKDTDGAYHYGSRTHASYANYLVSKLNTGDSSTSAIATAQKAKAYLDMYKALYGIDLYSVQK